MTSPNSQTLILPSHNLVQARRKVSDVVAVQSSHRYTSVHSQIDVRLLSQGLALLRVDSCETVHMSVVNITLAHPSSPPPKHPNLVNNMVPIPRCLQLLCQ